ncbi:hypothetical protein NDU88_010890 [Pleurodeles waltl]|uniref:Uncharacterized protein n=1 Tax=Pleurodeles waltl TaxID=8319 RepID=A0AAV7RZH5_PLEWA|nr:hypothetical protein NDU88_010890 [Pleurodeles waltl]
MPVTRPSLLTVHQSGQAGPARALLRRVIQIRRWAAPTRRPGPPTQWSRKPTAPEGPESLHCGADHLPVHASSSAALPMGWPCARFLLPRSGALRPVCSPQIRESEPPKWTLRVLMRSGHLPLLWGGGEPVTAGTPGSMKD